MAVISMLMASMSTFFVQSMSLTAYQRTKQAAVRVADDAVELVRALPGTALADGRDEATTVQQWSAPVPGVAAHLGGMAMAFDRPAPTGTAPTLPFGDPAGAPVKLNGVDYLRHWYVGRCWQATPNAACAPTAAAGAVPFFRVVVAVTWSQQRCPSGRCSHITATLVSSEPDDAVFNINEQAPPPTATVVSAQATPTSQTVSLQLVATGGSAPLTWSGANLPDGLTIASDGLISGTPTRTGTYTVTASVVDAFGLRDTLTFTWTVVAPLQLTNPGNRATAVAAAPNLTVTATGGVAPLTFSATGLPAGLTIDGSTGTVGGTPTTAGTYPVTVGVRDAQGTSRSAGFTWTVNATYQSLVLADNPLGYWRLDESAGPAAADSSGNGWTGTYQGGPAYRRAGALTGNAGTSVHLNGGSSGMTAPDRNDFAGAAPFTIEAWIRPTDLGGPDDYKTVLRKYGGSGYWLWYNPVYGFGFERSSTSAINKVVVGGVAANVWQHVVVTFDGATVRIYVNGALKGSGGSSVQVSDTTAPVEIGFFPGLPGYSVIGDVDEVAVYGTALSAARITAHHQKGTNG
jgi:hypothetical protein